MSESRIIVGNTETARAIFIVSLSTEPLRDSLPVRITALFQRASGIKILTYLLSKRMLASKSLLAGIEGVLEEGDRCVEVPSLLPCASKIVS